MLPDRVSNPGPLTYESGALPMSLTALCDSIAVHIGPSPRDREKEERND